MSSTIELRENKSPRINPTSPVIVLTNADYKRPSSILSSRSRVSLPCSDIYLPVYWFGILMLSCHLFIGMVRLD
jgi:hypothetical protein